MSRKALLIVDVQNDFCPGGALAVPNGDQVIRPLNTIVEWNFPRKFFEKIIASRDWHPANHCSFKDQGGPWPSHCVQNTPGAEFPLLFKLTAKMIEISKGWDKDKEAYSLFDGLYLRKDDWPLTPDVFLTYCQELYIGGLATDYCVKATALDAVNKGFKTYLLLDACRAVNVNPGDDAKALNEMANAGVEFTTTDEVINA